jgi:hypothetical protein
MTSFSRSSILGRPITILKKRGAKIENRMLAGNITPPTTLQPEPLPQ